MSLFRPLSTVLVAAGLSLAISAGAQTSTSPTRHKTATHSTAHRAAATDSPVVLTVGTTKVTAKELDEIMSSLSPQARSHPKEVAQQYGNILALVNEAKRRGLDQSSAFRTKVRLAREQLLAQELQEDMVKQLMPTEAEIKAYYDAHQSDYTQVKARHILISYAGARNSTSKRTKEQAKAEIDAIAARIKKGEDFGAIIKAESDDPGSKTTGGEYTFGPHQMVPEFEKVAFSLPVGQISDPFETPFGYHILQVESRAPVPMAQVRSTIEQQIVGDELQKKRDSIVAQSHIVLNDAYFAKVEPPAPAGTALPPGEATPGTQTPGPPTQH